MSTSSSSPTCPSTQREHSLHPAHLQAHSVDKLRHQESLWREDLQSGGNPRTTTPTETAGFMREVSPGHCFVTTHEIWLMDLAEVLERAESIHPETMIILGTATTFLSRKFGCRTSTHSHVFEPSRFVDSLFQLYVDTTAYHIATSIAGSSHSGRVTPIRLPNVMHHNSGETSSNCQVSVYVDKYCDLVGFPDLCASRSHVQGQVSGYISLMTESYSSSGSSVRFQTLLPVTRSLTKMVTSTSWQASHFRLTWQSWRLIFQIWRRKSSTMRLQLCLPASHSNTVD